jgi:hypothetical protein
MSFYQRRLPQRLATAAANLPVPLELIERRIYVIRGQKVMLDADLAELYQVPTKAFNQAVKRNPDRFPEDFMFRLSREELNRSQIVTGSQKHRDPRSLPYAFTELGVAMLSSVLSSKRAVQMNILVMRVFVKLREVLATHKDLANKMEQMAATQKDHATLFSIVIKDIQNLAKNVKKELEKLSSPRQRKTRIGFVTGHT